MNDNLSVTMFVVKGWDNILKNDDILDEVELIMRESVIDLIYENPLITVDDIVNVLDIDLNIDCILEDTVDIVK